MPGLGNPPGLVFRHIPPFPGNNLITRRFGKCTSVLWLRWYNVRYNVKARVFTWPLTAL